MELLYLYIESFRNIKNQQFSFTSEYEINFDVKSTKLTIEKSDKDKINLFDDSFLNINAIIGKNGCGKSNLLFFIKNIFTEKLFSSDRYLLIAKQEDNSILIINKISDKNKPVFEKDTLSNGISVITEYSSEKLKKEAVLAYFSNSYSIYEKVDLSDKRHFDLSLKMSLHRYSLQSNENLINQYDEAKEFFKDKNISKEDRELNKYQLIRGILPENLLYYSDLKYKIHFIVDNQKYVDWDFISKALYIFFDSKFYYNNKIIFAQEGFSEQLLKNIEFLLFNRDNYFDKDKQIERFQNCLIIYIFLYLIKKRIEYHRYENDFKTFIGSLNSSGILEIPALVKQYIQSLEVNYTIDVYNGIFQFIKNIDEEFNEFKKCDEHNNSLIFEITEGLNETIEKIFNFWKDSDFIFSFDWKDLSAGESALLTIFSRLHHASTFHTFMDTVWLLIDEGELYLHPEWQRTFLNDLHKYLPIFFKNRNTNKNRKIHLFITSHSPFIVSDLPKENILFLDKFKLEDEEVRTGEQIPGNCKIINSESLEKTFGQNIHTLLSDSFFMNEGLIGKFAEKKINEVIAILKSKRPTKKDREFAQNLIVKIGEPVIYRKLSSMFEAKFGVPIDIDKEIKETENRLKHLKSFK